MENNQKNWPGYKPQPQTTAPEPAKKKNNTLWIILGVIALGVLATIAILGKSQVGIEDQACCEKICGEFNQDCRGWNMDTLECTFNYDRYGYPWVEQIFAFKINSTNKELFCNQNRSITSNNTITFTNTTATANLTK